MINPGSDTEDQGTWIAAALAGPAGLIAAWKRGEGPSTGDPLPSALVSNSPRLLEVLAFYTGPADIPSFGEALANADVTALATLGLLIASCQDRVPTLAAKVADWYSNSDLQAVRQHGNAIGWLGAVVGCLDDAAATFARTARAFRAIDDTERTIDNYDLSIKVAEASSTDLSALLSASHDNLGMALLGVNRVDDAAHHFGQAERLETDPLNRLAIRGHVAEAYRSQGEYADAVTLNAQVADGLRALGVDSGRLAVALDNWGTALSDAGDVSGALAKFEEAAPMFATDAVDDRRRNRSSRVSCYVALERWVDAAATFRETWDLAMLNARTTLDERTFRTGYLAALRTVVPLSSPVWGLLGNALQDQAQQHWELARQRFYDGAKMALDAGDQLTHLRLCANAAAMSADAQQVERAESECRYVIQAANAAGLPLPIAMAYTTLASLRLGGSDLGGESEALEYASIATVYSELRDDVLSGAELPPDHPELISGFDIGIVHAQVGKSALRVHAYDVAEDTTSRSIEIARRLGKRGSELNRTVQLLDVLDAQPERRAEADRVAEALRDAAQSPSTPPLYALVILRALGARDPVERAIPQLHAAADILERLRAAREPGSVRADLDRAYGVYRTLVRRLQSSGGRDAEAFAALQAMRARRLMETLTARTGATEPYRPPEVAEVVTLLARQARATALVDVTLTDAGLRAYVVDHAGLRSIDSVGDTTPLLSARYGDVRQRAVDAVRLVTNSPVLTDLAMAVTGALDPGSTVLLAVDDELANLPLHAVPFGDAVWGDAVSIGRIPAIGALRFTPTDRQWSGISLVAGDSAPNLPQAALPGAARECLGVGAALGVPPLVGEQCTFAAVEAALDGAAGARMDVVHLAVHGRADTRRGGLSSLLFAGDPPEWVSFATLAAAPWRANLIVFSGCSTAVGGPRNGIGLYGIAQAAAEAGATTVIASLWPVDDTSAAAFMSTFYRELGARRGHGRVDLRELLDIARAELRDSDTVGTTRAVRDGRELILDGEDAPASEAIDPKLAAMIDWAPFIVIGDPMMPV